MLDEKIAKYLAGPTFSYVGTRDADNKPSGHRPMGQRVAEDGTLRVFFTEQLARNVEANLEANGPVAFATAHPATFEAYQFKGTFERLEPCNEADLAAIERWQVETLALCLQLGFPEKVFRTYLGFKPTIAIAIRVTEVFNQTPGPGAGEAKKGES